MRKCYAAVISVYILCECMLQMFESSQYYVIDKTFKCGENVCVFYISLFIFMSKNINIINNMVFLLIVNSMYIKNFI